MLGLNNFSAASVLENVVYIHLTNCGFEVKLGLIKEYEIDFIATKNNETVYFQVAYVIPDEKVKKREFGNLLLIKDNYPKYVVSTDEYPVGSYEGVKHMNIRKFLTTESY